MHTQSDKSQESKNQSKANAFSEEKVNGEPIHFFTDNRPEAVAQRKLQEAANNSPRSLQLRSVKEMANNSPQAKKAAELQAMANNYSSQRQQSIQRKENQAGIIENENSELKNTPGKSTDNPITQLFSNKSAPQQAKNISQNFNGNHNEVMQMVWQDNLDGTYYNDAAPFETYDFNAGVYFDGKSKPYKSTAPAQLLIDIPNAGPIVPVLAAAAAAGPGNRPPFPTPPTINNLTFTTPHGKKHVNPTQGKSLWDRTLGQTLIEGLMDTEIRLALILLAKHSDVNENAGGYSQFYVTGVAANPVGLDSDHRTPTNTFTMQVSVNYRANTIDFHGYPDDPSYNAVCSLTLQGTQLT